MRNIQMAPLIFGFCLMANQTKSQSNIFLTNGLVAYYPFNGNANDIIGNNNGTVFGASLTNDRFGNANQAYYFNGSNSYIQIPASATEFGSQDFSISIWFNPVTVPNPTIPAQAACFLISKGQNNFELATGSATSATGMHFLPRAASGNDWNTPASTYQTNLWQHVVAVYQPSTKTVQVFLNGISLMLTGPSNTPVGSDNSTPARLGMRSDGTLAYNGSLGSLRIYNRALTSNEVSQIYVTESSIAGVIVLPTVTIQGMSNRTYTIEYKNDLNSTNWTVLATNIVATNGVYLYPDTNAVNQAKRFYQVIPN